LAAVLRSDFEQWPGLPREECAVEVLSNRFQRAKQHLSRVDGVLEAGAMEEAPVRFALVDINEILRTLPHRYPMLLIDRVINIRTDYSGIGIKNVTFNEPGFTGHFPERPVYPGVMMIEAMAQTAGVIGIKSIEGTEKPKAVYFLTIDKCKFRKPVLPGDTIEYHMRRISRRKAMWWFHGDARVSGVTVAEAEVGAMLAD
jgi:3-hydroxyacyl-[acyl-carrier-protein] dehydratase